MLLCGGGEKQASEAKEWAMRLKIYLDTSVFSAYLDDTNPERMNLTRDFWRCLKDFDVNISEQVLAEIAATPDAKRGQNLENLTKRLTVFLSPLMLKN